MTSVHLDFETRSKLDIKKVGTARYAEACTPLCGVTAVGGAPTKLWLPGDPFPEALARADRIVAHHAMFEYFVWLYQCVKHGWPAPPPLDRWDDTMARCSFHGLPRGLGMAVMAANLPEKYWKDTGGKKLIKLLCVPQKKTKKNAGLLDKDGFINDPEKLQELYDYCEQDVEAERALDQWLPPLPAMEQKIWVQTQKMNIRGFPMDVPFVVKAVEMARDEALVLNAEAAVICKGAFTKLTQLAKTKVWLKSKGTILPNMQKKTIADALKGRLDPDVRRVLEIREKVGMASVNKYVAALRSMCKDGTLKGSQMYHGAGTGRWSATGFQPHNIVRPDLKPGPVAALIRSVLDGSYQGSDPLTDLANCLRGSIKAQPYRRFVGSDYAQVELRVLLWLAGANRQLQAIKDGADPYVDMAMKYYRIPKSEVTKDQRQVGKSAVLGCGFSLGGKTFRAYAENMGVIITDNEAQELVDLYRKDNPEVVRFWYALNDAALAAVKEPGKIVRCQRLYLQVADYWLKMRLPSGRCIMYYLPDVEILKKPWGYTESVVFTGMDTYTRKYGRTDTYGGKMVENATQGAARDLIARALLLAEKQGLEPVLTVHDEVLAHPPVGFDEPLKMLDKCMLSMPKWAKEIPMGTDGWTGKRYRK